MKTETAKAPPTVDVARVVHRASQAFILVFLIPFFLAGLMPLYFSAQSFRAAASPTTTVRASFQELKYYTKRSSKSTSHYYELRVKAGRELRTFQLSTDAYNLMHQVPLNVGDPLQIDVYLTDDVQEIRAATGEKVRDKEPSDVRTMGLFLAGFAVIWYGFLAFFVYAVLTGKKAKGQKKARSARRA